MFLYIDALFKPRSGCPLASEEAGGVLTTDSPGIRCVPPFMLEPSAIMVVVSSSGNLSVFDNEDLETRLADLGEYMESFPFTGFEECVGWYLDQIVIPVICANSMMCGVKSVTRWMRRLNDKWTKTMGFSLERAFWQGWYPTPRDECNDGRMDLTLDMAMKMSGLEIEDIDGSGIKPEHAVLLSRIAALNKLYDRYQKVATKE